MTRRAFLLAPPTIAIAGLSSARLSGASLADAPPLTIPIHRIVDSKARFQPGSLQRFWSVIWPQTVRDFARGGIHLQTTDGPGDVTITAADRPIFNGLRGGALNLLISDHLPLYWDNARSLPGVTTLHHGYHLSLIALRYAHADRVPFLSLNTCVHEMLHAILGDIFMSRVSGSQAYRHEYRVDWYATRLWLFHDGAALRPFVREYVARLGG